MKTRIDSWVASLTEEQSWSLFYKARRCQWNEAVDWAEKEIGLEKKPSRTAFYNWLKVMAMKEHDHNMAQAILAQKQARDLAKDYKIDDETSIKSLMSAATDAALLTHDAKLARQFLEMALAIRDRKQRDVDLKLKERSQSTKESELALAKEKFEAAEKRLDAAKGAISNAKLSLEEREAKLKEIFGL